MVLVIGGGVLMGAAVLYLGFKLHIVFQISGEPLSHGGVPTLDGIIFPPIFFTWGLSFFGEGSDFLAMPTWGYWILWIVLTLLAYLSFMAVQTIASKKRPR